MENNAKEVGCGQRSKNYGKTLSAVSQTPINKHDTKNALFDSYRLKRKHDKINLIHLHKVSCGIPHLNYGILMI